MPIEAIYQILRGFPGVSEVKSPPANVGDVWDSILITGSGRYPQRRKWQYNPGFLPGRSQGQRSLEGCRPWGPKELETTERLSTHVPIKSRNGEGRGKAATEHENQDFYSSLYLFALAWDISRTWSLRSTGEWRSDDIVSPLCRVTRLQSRELHSRLCSCEGSVQSAGMTWPTSWGYLLICWSLIDLIYICNFSSYLAVDNLKIFLFAQELSYSWNWVLTTFYELHQPESNCPIKYNSRFMPQQN